MHSKQHLMRRWKARAPTCEQVTHYVSFHQLELSSQSIALLQMTERGASGVDSRMQRLFDSDARHFENIPGARYGKVSSGADLSGRRKKSNTLLSVKVS